jgi:hypothetical protein
MLDRYGTVPLLLKADLRSIIQQAPATLFWKQKKVTYYDISLDRDYNCTVQVLQSCKFGPVVDRIRIRLPKTDRIRKMYHQICSASVVIFDIKHKKYFT